MIQQVEHRATPVQTIVNLTADGTRPEGDLSTAFRLIENGVPQTLVRYGFSPTSAELEQRRDA